MKLYYSPGACSLSPHIALREGGFTFDLEKVDLRAKVTASGADFRSINPKGSVPAFVTDAGDVLTEGPAIVQYIADQAPGAQLAPHAGTMERYRLIEWLNFITTELHKGFSPLFKPTTPEDYKPIVREQLEARFTYLNGELAEKQYLMGDHFTVADGYLFVILRWAKAMKFDLSNWPTLQTYFDRVSARPKVIEALEAEAAS
ncbi:MAG: glutathione transferase GstA [Beijerinckiaceae bacterium]|jgi:glutathione S-transferase|nr:glutathione transferase GstA [Beijerinckiaceae bacterium]MBX9757522.1 glutathione transferase GstA [Beijerinckiaceae bacterium]MDO9441581.1 glutathione transferase GstA [Beijerinckiaceae bacterium]